MLLNELLLHNFSDLPCGPNAFRCKNKRCIRKSALCDGVRDCGVRDDSDENAASCSLYHKCTAKQFQCESDQYCISKQYRCDDEQNCEHLKILFAFWILDFHYGTLSFQVMMLPTKSIARMWQSVALVHAVKFAWRKNPAITIAVVPMATQRARERMIRVCRLRSHCY